MRKSSPKSRGASVIAVFIGMKLCHESASAAFGDHDITLDALSTHIDVFEIKRLLSGSALHDRRIGTGWFQYGTFIRHSRSPCCGHLTGKDYASSGLRPFESAFAVKPTPQEPPRGIASSIANLLERIFPFRPNADELLRSAPKAGQQSGVGSGIAVGMDDIKSLAYECFSMLRAEENRTWFQSKIALKWLLAA
ncbi:hypothetical protein [Rhizobium indicum]|uniref:Uncharacterized protein n=1 Tax=Rhizobium indicum TaxID=2583231 RepID=A0ABX6PP88_9HYPH|nr:hypothetical protein [Rhizobium indicum]QKK20465.1 hypothetical protein FFM53_029220 [Rhizobium indicum]